jgi:hypothetical protein
VAYQSTLKTARQLIRDAEISAECDLLFLEIHPEWTPHDFIVHLRDEGSSKRLARQLLTRNIGVADFLLAPLCAAGEWHWIPQPLRSLAVRSLLFQCGLHWYHRWRELTRNSRQQQPV